MAEATLHHNLDLTVEGCLGLAMPQALILELVEEDMRPRSAERQAR